MSRRILLIASTLVLAVLGTAAVLVYVGRADERAVAGKQAVFVLVAGKKVSAGTSAGTAQRDGLLHTVVMPAETVPTGTVSDVGADLTDLVASADIQPGQLLLREMFVVKQAQTGGLALEGGKIAVSISVAGAQRVAGYVTVGSKVAVFDTFNVAESDPGTPAGDGLAQRQHTYDQATRLVLKSVEVVAIGASTTTGADGDAKQGALANGGASGDAVLVTVAVDQADAEKLIHAAQTGAVYLALLTDTSRTAPGPGVDNRTVFGR
jgi:pilus assembly protein CpaB